MFIVVVGIKDTEFWKQFTTCYCWGRLRVGLLLVSKILNSESNSQPIAFACENSCLLLLVSKILNSESNSQHQAEASLLPSRCCWYQRYWILKAIHNCPRLLILRVMVVVGIKDTEFWKQFTTIFFNYIDSK